MKVIDNLKSSVTIDDGVLLKASGFNYELRDSQIHINAAGNETMDHK